MNAGLVGVRQMVRSPQMDAAATWECVALWGAAPVIPIALAYALFQLATRCRGARDNDAPWRKAVGFIIGTMFASAVIFTFSQGDPNSWCPVWGIVLGLGWGALASAATHAIIAKFTAQPATPTDTRVEPEFKGEDAKMSISPTVLVEAKRDDGSLPPDWHRSIDPSTGAAYYYNEQTRATSWTRPVA
jgi:hypothetical protein